ncbi:MAG: hypothetical protein AAF539_13160, partial [Planctomycetota bacterium]
MSRFLYFVPDVAMVTQDVASKLGLQYAFDGMSIETRGVTRGPSGGAGAVAIAGDIGDQSVGVYPDQQTWLPAPQGDEESPPYWIGWPKDNTPKPDGLKRTEQSVGAMLQLEGGSTWHVPTLLSWHPGEDVPAVWDSPLPRMLDVDRYGNLVAGPIVPRYRDLFDVGMQILAKMVSGGDWGISVVSFNQFACDCLSVNYHVSPLELSARVLDCLSTSDAAR